MKDKLNLEHLSNRYIGSTNYLTFISSFPSNVKYTNSRTNKLALNDLSNTYTTINNVPNNSPTNQPKIDLNKSSLNNLNNLNRLNSLESLEEMKNDQNIYQSFDKPASKWLNHQNKFIKKFLNDHQSLNKWSNVHAFRDRQDFKNMHIVSENKRPKLKTMSLIKRTLEGEDEKVMEDEIEKEKVVTSKPNQATKAQKNKQDENCAENDKDCETQSNRTTSKPGKPTKVKNPKTSSKNKSRTKSNPKMSTTQSSLLDENLPGKLRFVYL